MPTRKPVSFLEVARRENLPGQNLVRKIRSIRGQSLDDRVREPIALLGPTTLPELVGGELHVDGHHVLPFGRERVVQNGRNRNIEIRCTRKSAVLRIVERALEIIDSRADMNAPR